jgi:transglutaminase-like putative cysteine protease
MTGPFSRTFTYLLLLALGSGSAVATSSAEPKPVTFEVAAVPGWVKPIDPGRVKTETDSDGISYLLSDQQDCIEPRATYYHEVRQITSESGVQNGSAISVSFDPSYQKLVFHFIRLLRKGITAERLDRAQIKLLQREKDMEEFLFDGTYTANSQLEDVRVGDVIEFAYTLEGDNPVKKGKYNSTFPTDWSFPVHRAVTRIVYPTRRNLEFRSVNRLIKPSITTGKGMTEWLLDQSDVPGRKADPETPPGYDPCGWVQVSEWATWEQVIAWAIPLYQIDEPLSADLKTEIDKLKGIADPEQRILTALRFVQDEIRYLGVESGVNSHQPTAPSEVLRRRFGDCKDKAILLCTLLSRANVDASPALVSGDHRSAIADRLPSSGGFDHVIVQVRNGQETYWLDATRAGQRGPLSQMYVTNFCYALVIRPGNKTLTAVAPRPESLPRKNVVENFRIPAPGGSAQLEVISNYRGRWAEETRSRFREKSREKIQKEYLQYYARRFPGITTSKTLDYEELAGENGCRTKESYLIPSIWQLNDEKSQYELFLYPSEVAHDMGSPGSSQRDDPLGLDHPIRTAQEIHADMFKDWRVDVKNQDVSNNFFHFHDVAKINGRHLQFTYSYESRADRVPVADLISYNRELGKLRDTLGYTLTTTAPVQSSSVFEKLGAFNWPIAALLGWVLTIAMSISAWLVYKSQLPVLLPPPATLRPMEGIGGWLILVAIHHFLRPIMFFGALVMLFPTTLDLEAWRLLTEPGQAGFHPTWKPALLFALLYNAICFIGSIFLLVLFFQKRAAWRRWYIVFLIVVVAGVGLDTHFVQQIPAARGALAGDIRDFVQVIVAAAIWIPYCLVSKRVKSTFRY